MSGNLCRCGAYATSSRPSPGPEAQAEIAVDPQDEVIEERIMREFG